MIKYAIKSKDGYVNSEVSYNTYASFDKAYFWNTIKQAEDATDPDAKEWIVKIKIEDLGRVK